MARAFRSWLFAALSLLGLQFLSEALNQGVLALPNILIAAALLLAGVVVVGLVRSRADRLAYQLDLPIPLGQCPDRRAGHLRGDRGGAGGGLDACAHGRAGHLLAAASATFALAFGPGGREVGRALSAGRYIRGSYRVGQQITVGEVRGEITAIESAFTVLATDGAQSVRVPNDLLLGSIVTVHEPEEPEAGASP